MNVEEFEGQLESARIEGRKLFGDDVMLLEKFVEILRYYYFICFRIMILLFLFIFNRDLLFYFVYYNNEVSLFNVYICLVVND